MSTAKWQSGSGTPKPVGWHQNVAMMTPPCRIQLQSLHLVGGFPQAHKAFSIGHLEISGEPQHSCSNSSLPRVFIINTVSSLLTVLVFAQIYG